MIARIEFTYKGRETLINLAKGDEVYAKLRTLMLDAPDEAQRNESWAWPHEAVIELDTDGRWLLDVGVSFEVKKFKGTMPIAQALPNGGVTNVYVQVPHIGLMMIEEVDVLTDCCTEELQRALYKGWRILCVCPPNAQRRPDYIIGRAKNDEHKVQL